VPLHQEHIDCAARCHLSNTITIVKMTDSAVSIPAAIAEKDAKSIDARQSVHTKEIQVPEWEHIAAAEEQRGNEKFEGAATQGASNKSLRNQMRDAQAAFMVHFDRALPPHRKYLRLSRKMFLIVLAGLLALLIFIIALAAGLSGNKR
jgi:polysaccharide pyruvyl transferase WcaK-like protein